ncbi:hypothetical protein Peur_063782 [Populus x canadensis]
MWCAFMALTGPSTWRTTELHFSNVRLVRNMKINLHDLLVLRSLHDLKKLLFCQHLSIPLERRGKKKHRSKLTKVDDIFNYKNKEGERRRIKIEDVVGDKIDLAEHKMMLK